METTWENTLQVTDECSNSPAYPGKLRAYDCIFVLPRRFVVLKPFGACA